MDTSPHIQAVLRRRAVELQQSERDRLATEQMMTTAAVPVDPAAASKALAAAALDLERQRAETEAKLVSILTQERTDLGCCCVLRLSPPLCVPLSGIGIHYNRCSSSGIKTRRTRANAQDAV